MNRYGKFFIALMALSMVFPAVGIAQTQDFRFHWSPSPTTDVDGAFYPKAVEYEVYVSLDGGLDELIGKVVGDTTYTLAAAPGIVHRIRVAGLDAAGGVSPKSEWSDPIYFEESRGSSVPTAASLQQNYPNPFNPETKVVYGIPADVTEQDRVQLDIFSINGRLIRTMAIDRTPGWHEAIWDGTDDRGRIAATGMYVTRLVVGTMVQTQKMTMLK